MAAMLAATGVVSASAATLTNENPDSSTEVTARIEGTQPGDVSYVITIPDMVDFGTLTQPQTDTQSNKYLNFECELRFRRIEFLMRIVKSYTFIQNHCLIHAFLKRL